MANLDDLDNPSITEMSNDEAIELIRQIRLQRRIPIKQAKAQSTSVKKYPKSKPGANLTPDQAAQLLKILRGE